MIIGLSPYRCDTGPIVASVTGDIITVDGIEYDLSKISEGDILPAGATPDCFTGSITRINGVINLTLRLPHGSNAPDSTIFPLSPITVESGDVPLPKYDCEVV